jgi:hypothetical protein
MSDTYKGDSPAKKLARAAMWWEIAQSGMPERGPIVFLASRDMGDYGCLKALGLAHRAIAVERNAEAFAAARDRFPDADVRHGDVGEVVRNLGISPAAVCLDFCGPIGQETMATAATVLAVLRPGAILSVGILRGREKHTPSPVPYEKGDFGYLRAIGASRLGRRFLASVGRGSAATAFGMGLVMGLPLAGAAAVKDIAAAVPGETPAMARAIAMAGTICNIAGGGPHLGIFGCLDYQSKTDASRGVPMSVVVYRARARRNRRGHSTAHTSPARHWYYQYSGDEDIRAKALSLSAEGLDAALMLNLPPGTVAAWKAHETRGTYKDEAAE